MHSTLDESVQNFIRTILAHETSSGTVTHLFYNSKMGTTQGGYGDGPQVEVERGPTASTTSKGPGEEDPQAGGGESPGQARAPREAATGPEAADARQETMKKKKGPFFWELGDVTLVNADLLHQDRSLLEAPVATLFLQLADSIALEYAGGLIASPLVLFGMIVAGAHDGFPVLFLKAWGPHGPVYVTPFHAELRRTGAWNYIYRVRAGVADIPFTPFLAEEFEHLKARGLMREEEEKAEGGKKDNSRPKIPRVLYEDVLTTVQEQQNPQAQNEEEEAPFALWVAMGLPAFRFLVRSLSERHKPVANAMRRGLEPGSLLPERRWKTENGDGAYVEYEAEVMWAQLENMGQVVPPSCLLDVFKNAPPELHGQVHVAVQRLYDLVSTGPSTAHCVYTLLEKPGSVVAAVANNHAAITCPTSSGTIFRRFLDPLASPDAHGAVDYKWLGYDDYKCTWEAKLAVFHQPENVLRLFVSYLGRGYGGAHA